MVAFGGKTKAVPCKCYNRCVLALRLRSVARYPGIGLAAPELFGGNRDDERLGVGGNFEIAREGKQWENTEKEQIQ